MKKKILAISGSTKHNSTNGSILRFIAEAYEECIEVDIYEDIDSLPHFNPDLDNEEPPTSVQELRKIIQSADGVIICTPEYVFSLPGSLKNAIEWNVSTTVFSGKPVAIIVASASGEKAFESLHLVMTTIEAIIKKRSTLLIRGAKGKVRPNGQIQDKEMIKSIDNLIDSLCRSIDDDQTPTQYQTN